MTNANNMPAHDPNNEDRYRPAAEYVKLDRMHRKRSSWTVVFVIASIILVASLAVLGVIWFSYLQGQQKYESVRSTATLPANEANLDALVVDWDALYKINPDIVAWVYIPGTAISYPVVQCDDNDYYLYHDFEGQEGWLAYFGCIFMDYRNSRDWSDNAYFIYGHHMNDGSMFADVARMQDQSFFDDNRTVYLLSPKGNFKLRSFSLVHCTPDDPLVQTTFATPEEMQEYVADKISRSIVAVSDNVEPKDVTKLFAFATCDNISAGRYVLYTYVVDTTVKDLVGTIGLAEAGNEGSGVVDDLSQGSNQYANQGSGQGASQGANQGARQ